MTDNKLKITFHGGVGTVTGANFLLQSESTNILVDCGLFQGSEEASQRNYEAFPYNPSTIDVLFITHGHLDHIGRVPKLVKDGFTGEIYSTPETKKLAALLYEDSIGIMESNKRKKGQEPMYDKNDVANTLSLWKEIPYHQSTQINDFRVFLKDSGHILGSAIIELTHVSGQKIIFSGDLGNSPTPLLRETEMITDANYLVMESVYGDKEHESVKERSKKLEDVIESVVKRNGTLLIPTFSIERTQVILYEINNLVESRKIPQIPVFLDSPLGIKVTQLYKESQINFNKHIKEVISSGDDIFNFPGFKITPTAEESKDIWNIEGPKVIIAGSGMSHGGRIVHHEKKYLSDPKNAILFVGFQAAGTLGRRILDGNKEVLINDEKVTVNAEIRSIFGYSAHKDMHGLTVFVENTSHSLKKVFVTMGEPSASTFLTQRLRDYIGVDAINPTLGETFILD
jgi:metallo-beta-lactamase family protein